MNAGFTSDHRLVGLDCPPQKLNLFIGVAKC
jgi:hypothetical protein